MKFINIHRKQGKAFILIYDIHLYTNFFYHRCPDLGMEKNSLWSLATTSITFCENSECCELLGLLKVVQFQCFILFVFCISKKDWYTWRKVQPNILVTAFPFLVVKFHLFPMDLVFFYPSNFVSGGVTGQFN